MVRGESKKVLESLTFLKQADDGAIVNNVVKLGGKEGLGALLEVLPGRTEGLLGEHGRPADFVLLELVKVLL